VQDLPLLAAFIHLIDDSANTAGMLALRLHLRCSGV
jgi:hypothetical protein